jgi:hypothetical protein
MVLADHTFQLDTGPILNTDSITPFFDVERVPGLDSPPFRETIRDHEGTDGGFIDAEFERGREVTIEGTAYSDVGSVEDYLDQLKENFAPRQSPIPFVFKPPGVAERVLFVKPRGARYDWELARRTGTTPVQLMMYAEDPRIYDNLLQEVVVPFGGLATTGFGFNFGFNLSFGAVVPPSGGTVVNAGNRPTPAILEIAGPVVDPRVVNTTDSRSLEFFITLISGDVLTVDLVNRTVVLNGTVNKRNSLIVPQWFLFNKGTTFVTFGGASGSGTLTIKFRNAWR